MDIIFKVYWCLIGACIGSFLNVCILRLPKDMSIVRPSSHCPKCKTPIKWYDNIPILSFFFLMGKCRSCREKISFRYVIVELLCAVSFLVLFIKLGYSLAFAKFAFLFCLLIVVSFIDIDYHAIPAYLCILGIIVGLFFSFFQSGDLLYVVVDFLRAAGVSQVQGMDGPNSPFFNSVVGFLFGLGFTYLFKLFGDIFISLLLIVRKKDSIEGETESLGLGDVDFMGVVGVFLGVKAVLLVFFIAPFFAILYSVSAGLFKKSHLIPYLPYLSAATVVVYFWGNDITRIVFGS